MKTKTDASTTANDTPLRPRRRFHRRAAGLSLALLLLPAPALLVSATAAHAQKVVERVVEGTVTNAANQPISGAVVYLKDSKTLAMKTYLTDTQGHYRFGQLSQNTDYELWAESNGERSRNRDISSFDSRSHFEFSFKVDKKQ